MTDALFTDDHAELNKKHVGEKYRPSNGSEGEMFMGRWCVKCSEDELNDETGEGGCKIIADAFCYSLTDENYPAEWQYGEDGQPLCSAFQMRDELKQ